MMERVRTNNDIKEIIIQWNTSAFALIKWKLSLSLKFSLSLSIILGDKSAP
jgi:hypothetical protein